MEKSSILHIPKSNYAYALDENNLNLWIRTKKNDFKNVFVKYCDPFMWCEGSFDCKSLQMELKYQTELFDYYFITLNSLTRRIKYCFILEDYQNNYLKYGSKTFEKALSLIDEEIDLFNYFNFPFLNTEDIYTSPSWSKNIVWYQIFLDRFKNKNQPSTLKWNEKENVSNHDVFGGNLLGVIEKLDYLKELGIGGIYFTPLFEAHSVHKYDTIDYFKIDSAFGTNEDFKLLVDEAHKRNIKVMLDIVFNHCGYNHPYFQDVLKNYKKSKYYDYFCYLDESKDLFIDDVPNYHMFAFVKSMPKWNTNNDEVRKYLLDVTRYWIENYDVDGYRLDVSNEVSHSFWKDFSNTCRSIKKDFFIIGENWDNSLPWLAKDQFDAVMNYELYYPLIRFFCNDNKQIKIDGKTFVSLINEVIISYPYNYLSSMFNLLGCHDTARIKTKCSENENLTKLAFIFLFSFTGSPNIYYGDEIGMSGNNDPDNRRCMNFDLIGNDFYKFIKKLIEIRQKEIDSCTSIHINWVYFEDNIIIFNKKNLFIILNNNDQIMKLPKNIINGKYYDLFNDKNIDINNDLILNSYQFYILKRR